MRTKKKVAEKPNKQIQHAYLILYIHFVIEVTFYWVCVFYKPVHLRPFQKFIYSNWLGTSLNEVEQL